MELLVERAVTAEELGADAEVSPGQGDFAARVRMPETDPHALAAALATRLLIDDGEGDPHTALLVTMHDAVRVIVREGVIVGLHSHADRDDVPDRLTVARQTYTRGDRLRMLLDAAPALDASASPDAQDAEHELVDLLRQLATRRATAEDDNAIARLTVRLRRAGAAPISDIIRCADAVRAAPWDPDDPA